mgnify:CR=1 FL=1
MDYEYYYNDVPGIGLTRNNLIYTSLISKDKKTFVQWYHNDTEYHKGQNQIIDPNKMDEKWHREMHFLNNMAYHNPSMVPEILEVDVPNRKIYLKIDGVDFWNRANCTIENYSDAVPDWQDQMIEIIKAHKSLGLHKYSMHPSSYFVIDGKLRHINYFFTYNGLEKPITINSFLSHISYTRRVELKKQSEHLGIDWDTPTSLRDIQILCFESFSNNYPRDFIEKAKNIFHV